jgi:hypothetical protein
MFYFSISKKGYGTWEIHLTRLYNLTLKTQIKVMEKCFY